MDDLRINRRFDNELSQPGYYQFYAPQDEAAQLGSQIAAGNTLIRVGIFGLLLVASLWLWTDFIKARNAAEVADPSSELRES